MLAKILENLKKKIEKAFASPQKEELERILLEADVGVEATSWILKKTKGSIEDLKEVLKSILQGSEGRIELSYKPFVIMIVGVNGSGKTTTVAKMATFFKTRRTMVISADTYRDAANEQLKELARRIKVYITESQQGQDPGAVVYDGLTKAVSKNMDVVIIDTAGRIHTRKELLKEALKIKNVCSKKVKNSPHLILVTLDATTGQSGIYQIEEFVKNIQANGIILTKLDGTAKGGIIISVWQKLKIPIYFIGTGEKPEDIIPFKVNEYISSLLGS